MNRPLLVTLLLFAAILGVCFVRYAPPAPRGEDAPGDQFSATRARRVQSAIAAGAPRALGTEANRQARALLAKELAASGWKTEQQDAMSCSRHGACGFVSNVVATREGREPAAGSVLLMAHFDSVPCSPGAGDDGFGTAAVVEAARALAAGPQLRRTVVVVLTDGEESGLLGAEAFARRHPLAPAVRGVVNVDSRGSRGPSAMFETSPGNAWLIGRLAKNVNRPVTSSLFYEIYRRMPNDTDFTAVKGRVQGVNFANIAGVEHYHTPLDSLADADLGTLEHHGEQALAMTRALAEAGPELDATRGPESDAVWFDVLALFIVRWPTAASLGLALTALALVLGGAIRMRAWGRGLAAPLAALVAALVGSLALGAALRLAGALPVPWLAHPAAALLSLHGTCIIAGLAAAARVGGGSRPETVWAGTWLLWGLLGVAAAIAAPGASFLFVVPTLAAGFIGFVRIDVASAVPAVVAAVLWMPIALLVHDGLGFAMPAVTCITSTLLVSTLAPLGLRGIEAAKDERLPRRWVGRGAAAAALIAALVATFVSPYSTAHPQRVNVVFRQDEPADGAAPAPARVFVEAAWAYRAWGRAPDAMRRALGDPARLHTEQPTPWSTPVLAADVPRITLGAPEATTLGATVAGGRRTVRARLRSTRGATTLGLVLPAGRHAEVVVEGERAVPRGDALALRAVPAEGVEITLSADGEGPLALVLLDVTSGLPSAAVAPVARAVLEARPAEATQTQEGDVTVASRPLTL
jgi:hypothetical protein